MVIMSILNNILPGIDTLIPLLNPAIWLYLPHMQCNFRCAYCYMNRCSNPRGNSHHPCNYNLPNNLSEINGWIFLYGGEPLSDKKLLYSLIETIRQKTNEPICFSTNGSLLTKDDINFFVNNNVKISLSYDGKYQKYRGFDIFSDKDLTEIIFYGIKTKVIIAINTVVHNLNYRDYKFNIPNIKIIHDYNYMYPIETSSNSKFLLTNDSSDMLADEMTLYIKNILLDIGKLPVKDLVYKYPPAAFIMLNQMLKFKLNEPQKLKLDVPLSEQTSCVGIDIYGNSICGKGYEMSIKNKCYLDSACSNCKFSSICAYKCPAFNFNKSQCKDTFIYKMYDKVDKLLTF